MLHLAPASLSGFNVCPMATQGCIAACLNTAGRGGMLKGHARLSHADVAAGTLNTIQAARIRRTRLYFENRAAFMTALVKDIRKAIRKAAKADLIPAFRLNGTSDIRFENVPVEGARNVFELFPNVMFYDYTKIANRKNIPANYKLTFSLADGNDAQAVAAHENGMNVAAVFRNEATRGRYMAEGFKLGSHVVPVINGDETDLRFTDPRGCIVGLYAKGNAKADLSGFVRD